MARVFRVASGKVAIWDDHTNDAPFTDPLANIARVKYHSDLEYIKIVDVKPFTLNLPAIANTLDSVVTYTLGPHGRPGVPFIVPIITVDGIPVAFTGSVCVHSTGNFDYGRWLAFGADATNCFVHQYSVQAGNSNGSSSTWTQRPAQTLTINAFITDVLL